MNVLALIVSFIARRIWGARVPLVRESKPARRSRSCCSVRLRGLTVTGFLDIAQRVRGRPRTEDDRFEQRVAAEAVRTVDADAGALAGSIHAGDASRAPLVGFDAAHRVVRARQDRNRFVDRILPGRVERQLANLREALENLFAAEMAHVEQHAAVDAAAFEDLRPLRARDDVARGQLALVRGVLEHEALALGVEQISALAARALGHQHAVLFQRRRDGTA